MCTAAERPWSTGVCERFNPVLRDNVIKIIEENQCSNETALAWAVAARNALHNNLWFSPNLPNREDSPSELEKVTITNCGQKSDSLAEGKRGILKVDARERIQRTLNQNIRKTDDENVDIGSYIYYKCKDENRWQGPAWVVGKRLLSQHFET